MDVLLQIVDIFASPFMKSPKSKLVEVELDSAKILTEDGYFYAEYFHPSSDAFRRFGHNIPR